MPMVNCVDCGKEISDSASTCPNCGKPSILAQKRKVGILLGAGILILPVVFSWFTLRKGHSTIAKIVSFVWLAICVVMVATNDDANKTGLSTVSASTSKDRVTAPQSTVVSIRTILSDYKSNEIGADTKYKDQLITTTGKVDDIKKDIMNNLYVTVGTGADFEIPQVQAFFEDDMAGILSNLKKGQQITVTCRIEGLMMNVLGKDCVIN